jgi:hypothetical protein
MKKAPLFLLIILASALFAQTQSTLPLPASGNVTLPLDEYNKLIELAGKPFIKPEAPPVPFAIKRCDLKLRVVNESVLGTAQCDGEVFAKGAARIPLLVAPTILDARQAGKALALEQQDGMQTAVLSGPGEFSIAMDTGMPLSIEAGRATFNLPVPAAGSAQLSLEIPGEHTNVKINRGLITRRISESGRTIVEATLVPGQPAGIWWATRELAAPAVPKEVRYLSSMKTLVSVTEAEVRLAVLSDITVIQGEPGQFEVDIPTGFEVTGVTGATLESEEMQSGRLIMKVNANQARSHQFLISMEKEIKSGKTVIPLLSLKEAQRETGEVLVEGEGTMELSATEGGTLKRMDVKETNTYLRSLARNPLHASFRYHRQPSDPPGLALAWTRFPDSAVLAAAAEQATMTTLVTSEGRSLTEVKLSVKNQAQPFLKVGLPSGASILTAEVAGEKVKPVQGVDGIRVPLLRPGFRPAGTYDITFVFIHAGAPFARKGDSELNLPKMDIPISFLQWEVFLPETYKVRDFGGDAIATHLLPPDLNMDLVGEFKMVSAPMDAEMGRGSGQVQAVTRANAQPAVNDVSLNVVNLQRRVSGDLPIHVDVPRAGNSYRFVRPLVLDEETKVTFKYKSK